jgi:hypothetical protein
MKRLDRLKAEEGKARQELRDWQHLASRTRIEANRALERWRRLDAELEQEKALA